MMVSEKIKHSIIIPRNSTFGYIPKRVESRDADICTPMVIAALFTVAKRLKQPNCPSTGDGINKNDIATQ